MIIYSIYKRRNNMWKKLKSYNTVFSSLICKIQQLYLYFDCKWCSIYFAHFRLFRSFSNYRLLFLFFVFLFHLLNFRCLPHHRVILRHHSVIIIFWILGFNHLRHWRGGHWRRFIINLLLKGLSHLFIIVIATFLNVQ